MYKVTVTLDIDAATSAEAADVANELLRGQAQEYTPNSALVDYHITATDKVED